MGQSEQAKMADAIHEIESKIKKVKDLYFNTENESDIDWQLIGDLGRELTLTSVTVHSEAFKQLLWEGVK
jgi:hypothetical protein